MFPPPYHPPPGTQNSTTPSSMNPNIFPPPGLTNSGLFPPGTGANFRPPPVFTKPSVPHQSQIIVPSLDDDNVLGERHTTMFIGSIHPDVDDEIIFKALQACGPVKKYNRVKDVKGKPKAFGFCEYLSPDSLLLAIKLFSTLSLLGKPLTIRIDDKASDYLKRFQALKASQGITISNPKRESDSLEIIKGILTDANICFSLELQDSNSQSDSSSQQNAEIQKSSNTELSMVLSSFKEKSRETQAEMEEKERERQRLLALIEEFSDDEEDYRRKQSEQHYQAYLERLKRWESTENFIIKSYEREVFKEKDRKARRDENQKKMAKSLAEYNDLLADDEYQTNRSKWFSKRQIEREKEERLDEADRKREVEENEKRKGSLTANKDNNLECAPSSSLSSSKPLVKLGLLPTKDQTSATTAASTTGTKRERPKAVEAFGDDDEDEKLPQKHIDDLNDTKDDTNLPIHKKRKLVAPLEYSFEDLKRAGYSDDEASKKMKELERELMQKIVKAIPISESELFVYPLTWEPLESASLKTKIASWINKKVNELLGEQETSLVDYIVSKLKSRPSAETLVTELQQALSEKDARVFTIKLWRFLIFESEYSLLSK